MARARALAGAGLWYLGAVVLLGAAHSAAYAAPRFLTLPFSDSGIVIQQGWIYSSPGQFSCPPPEGTSCHRGIDYVKGQRDVVSSWSSFDVLAGAGGRAVASRSTHYGLFVYIAHEERDAANRRYFTLYAHLKSANVPEVSLDGLRRAVEAGDFSRWSSVSRGGKVGTAGDSGSPGVIHLHFEVQLDGYPLNKTDPYDIRGTRDRYPVPCGANVLWTECPPVVPPETQTDFLRFVEGDPGVPGDGVVIQPEGGSNPFQYELSTPFPLGNSVKGITVSAFFIGVPIAGNPNVPDFRMVVRNLNGAGECVREVSPAGFPGGRFEFRGIEGAFYNYSQVFLEDIVEFINELRPAGCPEVRLSDLYVTGLSRNVDPLDALLDAAAIGLGENRVPE